MNLRREIERQPIGAANETDAEPGPDRVSVLAEIALLHFVAEILAGQEPGDMIDVRRQIIRMGHPLKISASQLGFAIAQDCAKGLIDVDECAIEADNGHPVPGGLESAAEALLPQLPVGAARLSTLRHGAQHIVGERHRSSTSHQTLARVALCVCERRTERLLIA